MRYFDSRETAITARHVMASGALPPAFPAIRIDGELYWDGGILSNTPTEVVFDDNPRKDSLIFAVHLWNPTGPEPTTMAEVLNPPLSSIAQPIIELSQAAVTLAMEAIANSGVITQTHVFPTRLVHRASTAVPRVR